MGARTSWGTIPPKTARSDTRPAPCTHFLPGRSFSWKGWGRRPSPLPQLLLKGQSAKPASLGGFPHWGERWVVTPPYSVHGNAEGESRLEAPESLLTRERPSCHRYPGSPPLPPDDAALPSQLLVVAKVASMVTCLSCLHFYMGK